MRTVWRHVAGFTTKKDCICKHERTIYVPKKHWGVNLNALRPHNLPLLEHSKHLSKISKIYFFSLTETPFDRLQPENSSVHTAC